MAMLADVEGTTVRTRPTAREALRSATAQAHHWLEQKVDVDRRTRSRSDYVALLTRMWGFHAALEPELAKLDWTTVPLDIAPRLRAHLLRLDLCRLGIDDTTAAALPLCPADRLPRLDTTAQGLGCLYVLEGSTLGGRVLSRRIADRLGIGPEDGAAYYHAHGAATGPMWQALVRTLDTALTHTDDLGAAVTTALATFGALGVWMSDDPT